MTDERIACEGCGESIHPRFAQCPLCGHRRRARAEVRPISLDHAEPASSDPGPPALPRFETRPAEVAVTGPLSAVRSALVPAPHTRGWMRVTEILLTVVTLPLFAASALALFFVVRRWGRIDAVTWVLGAAFGSLGLWMCFGAALGVDGAHVGKVILISLAAWTLRSVLRALSALRARDG